MTREEAIQILADLIDSPFLHTWEKQNKALHMAIEALQAEPTKAVPPSLADVYKWERDIALSQLEEYGIGFAEKKRDDLLEVVRCKDCRWWKGSQETKHNNHLCKRALDQDVEYWTKADDFCSYGERREP